MEHFILFENKKEYEIYSVSFRSDLLEIEPWNCATVMLSIMLLSSHTLKSHGKLSFIPLVPHPIVF